ncbi:hypothetical protein [Carboxylicivirga taeanensis]|uniref:hypothetical protein n=1 Tax=Carboxylicivirga taeanensis TaxID=1416875 RepID=UPI003F6DC987
MKGKLFEIEKKFAWTLSGFIVTLIALIYSIYVANKDEDKPLIGFEIISSNEIVQVSDNIDSLKILYRNKNIITNDTSVFLVSAKLLNYGTAPIRILDYDSNCPLGLEFEGYSIINKPSIIDYSSDYLNDNLNFLIDSSSISIAPIILEENDFVSFSFLLYGSRNKTINLTTHGKVAGQKEIETYIGDKEKDKWEENKVYIAFGLLCILGLFTLGLIYLVDFYSTKFHRRYLINKFRKSTEIEQDVMYEGIFRIFMTFGKKSISSLLELSDSNELDGLLKSLYFKKQAKKSLKSLVESPFDLKISNGDGNKIHLIDLLSRINATAKLDGRENFTKEFKYKLSDFYSFIK